MTFAFDLISDLHVETWPGRFQWQGMATSPYCVVAGDVARDRDLVIRTLRHLGECYQAVFYIDGNDEHAEHWEDLGTSYQDLARRIKGLRNVVYLQDNVVVINGVAILGTNGWWGFDFGAADATQSALWYQQQWTPPLSGAVIRQIASQSTNDSIYMTSSVRRLQTHNDVRHLVIVTHTLPDPELIAHDIDLSDSYRFNCMGNGDMITAFDADSCGKMHTWCFGHYHMPIDRLNQGVRFVNNCRGRGDSAYRQWAYQPRRIEIAV